MKEKQDIFGICDKYCIGCGICNEIGGQKNERNGFNHYCLEQTEENKTFLQNVCPVGGITFADYNRMDMWGDYVKVYEGYSNNPSIRKSASSGGILTSVALFLFETKQVDAIIQIAADDNNPISTSVRVNRSENDIINSAGSRYCISSLCNQLKDIVIDGEKYAIIGKPCDIAALKSYSNKYGKYTNIIFYLSFFCAGMPSTAAQKKLIEESGCVVDNCKSVTYRGNGWPGKTLIKDSDNITHELDYAHAWGGILGRDVHPYCRICIDGIGAYADVVGADYWYLDENKNPVFLENEGRNVIFARTDKGDNIIREATGKNYIFTDSIYDISELKYIQKYQYMRRTTMNAKKYAYKIMNLGFPFYDKALLKRYSSYSEIRDRFRIFVGTLKRIKKHTID